MNSVSEYSFEEGLKRRIDLVQDGEALDLKDIETSIYSVIESLSELKGISDLPKELILSMVVANRIPDLSAFKMNSVSAVYIFFGILLGAYLHSQSINFEAPTEKITEKDIQILKAQLDMIYEEKKNSSDLELHNFKNDLYSYYEELITTRDKEDENFDFSTE